VLDHAAIRRCANLSPLSPDCPLTDSGKLDSADRVAQTSLLMSLDPACCQAAQGYAASAKARTQFSRTPMKAYLAMSGIGRTASQHPNKGNSKSDGSVRLGVSQQRAKTHSYALMHTTQRRLRIFATPLDDGRASAIGPYADISSLQPQAVGPPGRRNSSLGSSGGQTSECAEQIHPVN